MTEPQWDDGALELAVRRATVSVAIQAADIAQYFAQDERFSDVDPKAFATLKLAIADDIREKLGGVA